MATYLPVLLVSVTNAAPDDSFVTNQPSGQVDYLSHDWQEEDVWRSWRNMTRQKNEIANGVRLENASWRTWWKQRNKLKTVTPETLNWLKDSDVTWLYGPLHKAIDYKPPPKSPSVWQNQSSDMGRKQPSKPILKHRSISQLLTSDLPSSPVLSPPESDDEHESDSPIYDSLDQITRENFNLAHHSIPKRPTLLHTKSDTHITRWGPNRAFRKDSPPRIDPPGGQHDTGSYFPQVSAGGAVRTSLSQDSNSSASQSGERTGKKKHITFNTFVEQCIAIEKPKRSSSLYVNGGRSYYFDDGYEEDQEDSPEGEADLDASWGRQRIPRSGDSDSDSPYEEDNGIIEMRTSYRNTPKKKGQRSQSKVSNTSSSSSVSTASSTTNSTGNSSSPSRSSSSYSGSTIKRKPLSRRASTSTYRPKPPLIRTAPTEHVHVTIAPIAPTVLKTTGAWEEGFGDDGAGSDDGFGWRDRMWVYEGKKSRGKNRTDDESQASDGTPVELVYVPPFNSRYSYGYEDDDEATLELDVEGYDEEDMEEDFVSELDHTPRSGQQDSTTSDVYHHRNPVIGSVGFEDFSGSPDHNGVGSIPIPIPATHTSDDIQALETHEKLEYPLQSSSIDVPKVVVMDQRNTRDEDEFDLFDGPDLGDEYMTAGSGRDRQPYHMRSKNRGSEERQSRSLSRTASSRSRSKSHSRTPSPSLAENMSSSNPSVASSSTLQPSSSRPALRPPNPHTASSSQPQSAIFSPRGRSQSHQDLLQASQSHSSSQSGSRGRSATRTPPSSTWDSSSSPLGSLSPDTSISPRHAMNAYVGGGRLRERGDRDRRGREDTRDRGRGRSQTTDKRLSVSLSNSPEPPRRIEDNTIATTPSRENPPSASSTCSPTSSTQTIVPDQDAATRDREANHMRLAEEELRRKTTPTPSNSPVLEMRGSRFGDHIRNHAQPIPSPTSTSPATSNAGSQPLQPPLVSPTPTKNRPPPLVPSPSHAVPPSTSYTAVSSPSPTSPKGITSPHLLTTAATVPSPEQRPSSQRPQESDSSIIGKAAEIVSSAGAFFGLWNHL